MKIAQFSLVILLSIIFLTIILHSQPRGNGGGANAGMYAQMKIGTITGIVHEANSDKPVIYANVTLKRFKDSSIVSGDITDNKGYFEITELPPGRYIMDIKFLGFETKPIDTLKILPKNPTLNMGVVYIEPTSFTSEGVEVTAEKERVEYKLDRRVINISNDIISAGGTAVEALERTPSINVDLEGNVSLRGSTQFTVLINGKPSVLDGTDALQQIPVSSIEQIEIMTNPSAKYDPDGIAGIINVVLKESGLKGLNGMISSSAGMNDKYDFNLNVNYGLKDLNLTAGIGYNRNRFLMEGDQNRVVFDTDNDFTQNNETSGFRDRNGLNLKLGADYSFSRNFSSNVEFGYGMMEFERFNNTEIYTIYPDVIQDLYTFSSTSSQRNNGFYSASWGTNWKLDDIGQLLTTNIFYSERAGEEIEFQEEFYSNEQFQKSSEYIFGADGLADTRDNELRINLDYKYPFNDITRIEAGYQAELEYDNEDYTQNFLDTLTGISSKNELFSNEMDFTRNIHALYGLYVSQIYKFEYQLGLRAEYTDRNIAIPNTGDEFIIDRVDLFPSLNFSRQFEGRHQIIGGYSRRISRPRGWSLEPFPSFRDRLSYNIGNPEIEPEYTNSIEFGYQKYFDNSYISAEGYYRHTTNKIERFGVLDELGLVRYSSRNLGESASTGLELSYNLKPLKWLNFNLVANIFYLTIAGEVIEEGVDTEDITWNSRGFIDINLTQFLRLQISGFLQGPQISSQGKRDAFYFVDTGLRFDAFDRKLSMTLNGRNLFGTMGFEIESQTSNLINNFHFRREASVFQLTVSYRFNDYKQERNGRNGGNGGMEDMDF